MPGGFQLESENENIHVLTVSPEETYQMLEDGLINNSTTMLAVQWFQLNGDKLRYIWHGKGA